MLITHLNQLLVNHLSWMHTMPNLVFISGCFSLSADGTPNMGLLFYLISSNLKWPFQQPADTVSYQELHCCTQSCGNLGSKSKVELHTLSCGKFYFSHQIPVPASPTESFECNVSNSCLIK
jgi:hypothetical protein